MTLYFTTIPGLQTNSFTVSIPNADQQLLPNCVWNLSLRSELTHVSPVFQSESQIGMVIDIVVGETNDRYTTFEISNNAQWLQMRDYLKDGIYIYQIIQVNGLTNEIHPWQSGVAKVITQAGLEPTKDIVKYTSDNEDNSGFVYYSDTL